jgi:hypothetical protein
LPDGEDLEARLTQRFSRAQRKTRLGGTSLARDIVRKYFAHVPAAWEQRLAPHYAWAILYETSEFAMSPGKHLARFKPRCMERREQKVDMLEEEARAVLAGRM